MFVKKWKRKTDKLNRHQLVPFIFQVRRLTENTPGSEKILALSKRNLYYLSSLLNIASIGGSSFKI